MAQAIDRRRERKPISTLAAHWIGHIRRFTPRTQELYKMVLRKFLAGLPKDLTLNHLAAAHINSYINKLLFKNCNATANRHLTVLKSFCRWLADNYQVPNIAAKIRNLTEDPPKQRVLTPAEYDKVLSVCSGSETDCIQFLGNTGIRATEMTKVRWCDISDDLRWLTVYGKGRKIRMIPLNSIIRSILARYERKPESHIQILKSTRFQLYRLCESLASRASVSRFGPHALRHYFATELYSKGVPVNYISKLLGHSSTKTTEMIYVHFQYGNLEGVTEILACESEKHC